MRLHNLSAISHKNWEIMLSEDVRLKCVFPKHSMICYTREHLCTAKLPQARARIREVEKGFKRCGRSGSRMCPFTGLRPGEVQEAIMVTSTGEELPIRGK